MTSNASKSHRILRENLTIKERINMDRVESVNLIRVYEVAGEELPLAEIRGDVSLLEVRSHCNRREFSVLKFQDKEITIVRADLEKALSNSGNV